MESVRYVYDCLVNFVNILNLTHVLVVCEAAFDVFNAWETDPNVCFIDPSGEASSPWSLWASFDGQVKTTAQSALRIIQVPRSGLHDFVFSGVLLDLWIDERVYLLFASTQISEDPPQKQPTTTKHICLCYQDKRTTMVSKRKLSDLKELREDKSPIWSRSRGPDVHETAILQVK